MNLWKTLCPMLFLLALALAAPGAIAAEPAPPAPAPTLDDLIPRLADADLNARQNAVLAFRALVFNAGRPGAEAERAALAKTLAEKLAAELPQPTALNLIEGLEYIGREEAVARLAALLGHADPLTRERARCALVANPSPKATAPLVAALREAKDPAWQVALVNALGARKDKAAVAALLPLAKGDDEAARVAACEALGSLGDKAAAAALSEATQKATTNQAWRRTLVAYLALADALAAAGDKAAALPMYRNLLDAKGFLKAGAIVGLGRAGGTDELPTLLGALADPQPQIRGAAQAALDLLPVQAITQALKTKAASPEVRVGLLQVLSRRGDPSVLPALTAAAGDAEESVRIAAYDGLGKLAHEGAVPTLLAALTKVSDKELDAVKAALGRLHGEAANQALVAAVAQGAPATRVAVIELLAARRAASATPALLKAAEDKEAEVRQAALKALGAVADEQALGHLIRLVVQADDETLDAAEKALAATCKRATSADACAEPLLAALPGAPVPARCALLRVLGRVESDKALAALREARKDATREVQEAAIRALAGWPNAAVLNDLLEIARTAQVETHRVLALRGYVRVAGLATDRTPEETVKLYEDGMAVAKRPEDKRLVLGGIAEVANLASLQMAARYLDDADLKTEAAVAAVKIAETVLGLDREATRAALEKALAATTDAQLVEKAKAILDHIGKLGDYLTAWEVAGPYTTEGGSLFTTAFPPEKPDDKTAQWRIIPPTSYKKEHPEWVWVQDLGAFLGGDNRAAYLRTQVWSPQKQEAVLELGSDDGVKAWLNGKEVFAKDAPRNLRLGDDKVKVTLEQGWNPLLLKVVNGGGEWGAAARLTAPDGQPLPGLRANPAGR